MVAVWALPIGTSSESDTYHTRPAQSPVVDTIASPVIECSATVIPLTVSSKPGQPQVTDEGEVDDSGSSESEIVKTADLEEATPVAPPKYVELSDAQIRDFAALIWLEARGETDWVQKAVGAVVLNRMTLWDKSFEEVVYAPNQFTPAKYISSTTPDQKQLDIVHDLINNGLPEDFPEYVCYFRASYYHDWSGCNAFLSGGNTYFSYTDIDYSLWQEKQDR